jgi:hypothetical protein
MKKCSKCKIEKDDSDFHKCNNTKDGLYSSCKECRKLVSAEYYKNNKETIIDTSKQYYNDNKSIILEYRKEYYEDNKEIILRHNKQYYEDNKEEVLIVQKTYRDSHKNQRKKYNLKNKEAIKEYNKKYAKSNRNKIVKKHNEYQIIRRKNDPAFRIRGIISNMINKQLESYGSTKNGKSCLDYLPYSIQELKEHIEQQFEIWMNWDNHGKYDSKLWDDNDQSTWTWQIDHIVPQSDLPYSSMTDDNFKKCWALSNLRPYSAKQNLLDGITKIRHKESINEQ